MFKPSKEKHGLALRNLTSGDKVERRSAVNIIFMCGDYVTLQLIVTNHTQDILVRKRAIELLGEAGVLSAVRYLTQLLDTPGSLSAEAAIALAKIKEKTCV